LKKASVSTGKLVRLAVLVAILLIMCFTPLGRLQVGPVFITFNMVPVVIGAVILGPGSGAILGGIFGLWSFSTCFGTDAMGTILLGINPFFTFIMCFVPRVLAGWLPGLVFRAFRRTKLDPVVGAVVTCFLGSAFNTVFFITALWGLFGQTDIVQSLGANLWAIFALLVGTNAIIEAAVATVAGAGISRAMLRFVPERKKLKGAN